MRILVLLLALPIMAAAQDAPKGAERIIVAGTSLSTVADKVLEAGFVIDKKDADLGTIRTIERAFDKTACFVILNIRVKDSVATISGELKSRVNTKLFGDIEQRWYPVVNKGMKGGDYKILFGKMEDLAKSFGGTITYK